MQRGAFIERLTAARRPFDVAVIGGGANGAGIALDAASRGLTVALFERGDFGSGTSSRSSKLIHGGVRYLALGQWSLVREALRERALLLANAPAIVRPLRFVLPAAGRCERLKFACGLKLYDALAGARGAARSAQLDLATLSRLAPGLATHEFSGGVAYDDARFDDARLVIALLRAAVARGATALNYCEVVDFMRGSRGALRGVVVRDGQSGACFEVAAQGVVNAAGVWGDRVRRQDDARARAALLPSQGAHVVVARHFLGTDDAVVLPHTPDGRIMFALPWHGHTLLGTTDTALPDIPDTPQPLAGEVDMILGVAARYLKQAPSRADVLSAFAGVRPLALPQTARATARISREHAIAVSDSGLVSVSGGKWTTYRMVAAQAVDAMLSHTGIAGRPSPTATLALDRADEASIDALIAAAPGLAERLHPALPCRAADIVWAVRGEMALHVGDALAYRTRALFIDARAAAAIAPAVAAIMAEELGENGDWVRSEMAAFERACALFSLNPIPVRDTRG